MSDSQQGTTTATQSVPSFGQLVGFGIGSVGMGVWATVPGLLLLFYLTNIVGVSPFLAGLTLLLPKLLLKFPLLLILNHCHHLDFVFLPTKMVYLLHLLKDVLTFLHQWLTL